MKRLAALLPVRALHVLEQTVEIADLSPELHGSQGTVLLIGGLQLPLPDDVRNQALVRGSESCVHHSEHLSAEFFFKLRTEGAFGKGALIGLPQGDQGRRLFPQPFDLPVIVGICGVNRIAHRADGEHGEHLLLPVLQRKERGFCLLVGVGLPQSGSRGAKGFLHGLHAGSDIGDFLEFHHFHG